VVTRDNSDKAMIQREEIGPNAYWKISGTTIKGMSMFAVEKTIWSLVS
jgi:hypothetical protein